VQKIYNDHIEPVLRGPRLLSGHDLITEFALEPGPLFSTILEELEAARVEGTVTDRQSALAWVGAYLQDIATGRSPP
jgi:poly(A) polymerase